MNHLRDTGRQADGAVQRLRSELREMNKQRHAELQRFESMRLSQQESRTASTSMPACAEPACAVPVSHCVRAHSPEA